VLLRLNDGKTLSAQRTGHGWRVTLNSASVEGRWLDEALEQLFGRGRGTDALTVHILSNERNRISAGKHGA
jgi:hypothetical protein